MISSVRGIRRWLAPLLTGVLLATSAAVPLLDGDAGARTPALETEHHPGTCHAGHDHRICTLAGLSHWVGAENAHRPEAPRLVHEMRPAPVRTPIASRSPTHHRSRAPPVV